MNDANGEPRDVMGECPSRAVLSDLALGKLPMGDIDSLGQHVEACSTCQGIMETLDGLEDSVVADIKGQTGPLPPNPQLQDQIRQAEEISRIVWGEPKPVVPEQPPPARLGQYAVLEKIGQGGMGAVYKAVHTRLKRLVAMKMLPASRLADPQAVARFQREMEAVGQLDHPHLVRAHDAGEAEGQHFLVMEYLDGIDLARLVRRTGPLSVADACEAVRQAALGLQHAHEHGLVHRDIKPSNLMLTTDGQIKILDLGLARLIGDHAQTEEMTATGQIVGTGDFIAPEQGQDTRQADARSDIYALGCTLYFLLAGKAPFSGPQHDTFVKKVMAHANEPIPPIQIVRRDIPDAVAAIVDRMTAKDPEQRFQTAAEVAKALVPFVEGNDLKNAAAGRAEDGNAEQPVQGRRRNGIGYLLGMILLVALGFAGYQYAGAVLLVLRGEGVLVVVGDKVDVPLAAQAADGSMVQLDLDGGHTVRLKAGEYDIRITGGGSGAKIEPERVTIHRGRQTVVELYRGPLLATTASSRTGARPQKAGQGDWFVIFRSLDPTIWNSDINLDESPYAVALARVPENIKYLKMQIDGQNPVIIEMNKARLDKLTFADKVGWNGTGSVLWNAGHLGIFDMNPSWRNYAGAIKIKADIRPASGWGFGEIDSGPNPPIQGFCWARQAIQPTVFEIAVKSGDLSENEQAWLLRPSQASGIANFSQEQVPGELRHGVAATAKPLVIGLLASKASGMVGLPHSFVASYPNCLVFDGKGQRLASAGNEAFGQVWDVASGKLLYTLRGHSLQVRGIAFSPDGTTLATVGFDQTIKFWDAATGSLRRSLAAHTDRIQCVAYSPNGSLLVTAGNDCKIIVRNTANDQVLRTLDEHKEPVRSIAFASSGSTLVSGSEDGTLKTWDCKTWECRHTFRGHVGHVLAVAYSPDGSRLASGGQDMAVRFWDAASGNLLNTLEGHTKNVFMVAFSPDGSLVASVSGDKTIKLWDTKVPRLLRSVDEHTDEVETVAFSPDGTMLVSGGRDNTIKCWNLAGLVVASTRPQ